MNTSLLASIKWIVSKHGEAILGDPERLKPEFAKLSKNEPKEERIAFGRCIEMGGYNEIKKARTENERLLIKANLVQQLHDKANIDINLCIGALDLLDAAVFGNVTQPEKKKTFNKKYVKWVCLLVILIIAFFLFWVFSDELKQLFENQKQPTDQLEIESRDRKVIRISEQKL